MRICNGFGPQILFVRRSRKTGRLQLHRGGERRSETRNKVTPARPSLPGARGRRLFPSILPLPSGNADGATRGSFPARGTLLGALITGVITRHQAGGAEIRTRQQRALAQAPNGAHGTAGPFPGPRTRPPCGRSRNRVHVAGSSRIALPPRRCGAEGARPVLSPIFCEEADHGQEQSSL